MMLKVLDVDGAVRRVQGGWIATGRAVDVRPRALRPRGPGPRGRAAGHAPLPRRRHVSHGDAAARPRRPVRRAVRPLRRVRRPVVPDRRVGRRRRRRPATPSTGPASTSRRAPSGRPGMDALGVGVKGKVAADEQMADGRAVARLSDIGWGTRLRELVGPGAADDAPVTTGGRERRRRRAQDLGLGAAPRRRRRHAVADPAAADRHAGRAHRRPRQARAPRLARVRPRRAHRRPRRQQRPPAGGGVGPHRGPARRRRAPAARSPGRCSWWTTSPTRAGRSRSRRGPCASPAHPPSCRSRSPSTPSSTTHHLGGICSWVGIVPGSGTMPTRIAVHRPTGGREG